MLATPASAASVESGAAFLQLDSSARPAAMAGAYTAAAGDVDTLSYNPGGLAALDRREAVFTHAEWLVGTGYDHLAYGQPTRVGTFALSATRLGYGDLEGRDALRRPTGDFDAHDSAYSLGYARKMGDGVGLGGAFKYLRRTIDADHSSSYAMDFGGVGKLPGRPLHLGASILNVGPGMRFIEQTDPLPLTLAVGAGYEPNRALKLAFDLKHQPNDRTASAMGGLEYSPIQLIALRAGYHWPLAGAGETDTWDINNFRAGLGLQIARLRFDYALAAFGELGITHRFTLAWYFDPRPDEDTGPKILKSATLPTQGDDPVGLFQ